MLINFAKNPILTQVHAFCFQPFVFGASSQGGTEETMEADGNHAQPAFAAGATAANVFGGQTGKCSG